MHFLAHLQLANGEPYQQIGQIAGDFAKGLELAKLHPEVALGVRRHRACDSFTDSHPYVRQSKALLDGPYRRYAGLVFDLYYDHLLARHWHAITGGELRRDADAIYASLEAHRAHWTSGMERFTDYIIDSDMLARLAEPEIMEVGLRRIASRLKRKVDLTPAIAEVERDAQEHERLFLGFYPELVGAVGLVIE
ncbi:MAG: ACP phosphodiesterase [Granulosicoccaceae bacterium]